MCVSSVEITGSMLRTATDIPTITRDQETYKPTSLRTNHPMSQRANELIEPTSLRTNDPTRQRSVPNEHTNRRIYHPTKQQTNKPPQQAGSGVVALRRRWLFLWAGWLTGGRVDRWVSKWAGEHPTTLGDAPRYASHTPSALATSSLADDAAPFDATRDSLPRSASRDREGLRRNSKRGG